MASSPTEMMLRYMEWKQNQPQPVAPPAPARPVYGHGGAGLQNLDLDTATVEYLQNANPDLWPTADPVIYTPPPKGNGGGGGGQVSANEARRPGRMERRHPHRFANNHGGN